MVNLNENIVLENILKRIDYEQITNDIITKFTNISEDNINNIINYIKDNIEDYILLI